ncbi:cytochrome P450 [Streptomyces sp. NPDC050560]|uniref:cytochrome P450 n=1 Tax=Streptomyces sp. NPDC050560 TaxID=3365630 RepID=UPI0037B646FB
MSPEHTEVTTAHEGGTPDPGYPFPLPTALDAPPAWERLRGGCPVAPVRFPSGDGALLLTRYDDVKRVLADPRATRDMAADDAARITATETGGVFNDSMATSLAAAGHLRWRRMLNRWFTAKRVAALRPGMETMAERLVDAMLADGAPADLKARVGFPLPVWVICDLLGVPEADRDRFAHWSDMMLNLDRYRQEQIEAGGAEFRAYMAAHIDAKRDAPGDDLLGSLLTAADPDGAVLTDDQLIATGQALLIAGHETTANMIGKMMAMLLAEPARWRRVTADPTPALVRTTVEEILRYDANAGFGMPRYLTEDIEVGGAVLPRGATVVCSMAAANRDDAAFEDASALRLDRTPNPHLTFGVGPHSCLGQSLARTELATVLTVLARRLPSLALAVPADELRPVEGLLVGGLRELPVRW